MIKNHINIFGASGHCKVVIDAIENSHEFQINKIIDDNDSVTSILNYAVSHSNSHQFIKNDNYIIAIGNNKIRKIISERLLVNFVTVIHSKAFISRYSSIDVGTVVFSNAIVNASAKIGKHVIINSGAIVEHDCIIEDFVHVCPGAKLAGGIKVGEGTTIGIGASIINGIKIGKWVTIGAGASIIEDVPDYAVVVGIPGKIIKYNKSVL